MNRLLGAVALALGCAGLAACSGGSGDAAAVTNGGGGGGATASQGSASIVLTDAPSDDLSSFEVDIAEVALVDDQAVSTTVFPASGGSAQTVNLLDLQGINTLLGSVTLPNGTYESITFTFENATATDASSNVLSVTPVTSGSLDVMLSPALVIDGTTATIELDFDLASSVTDVVTGSGGSVVWNPVIVAKQQTAGSLEVDDVRGRVVSVSADSLEIRVGRGVVTVETDTLTVIEDADGNVSAGVADLSILIETNDKVEVDGSLDAASRVMVASSIEIRRDVSILEREFRGLVTAVGTDTVEVLVTSGRVSALNIRAGSSVTVDVVAATVFTYDEPEQAATLANVEEGQEVRVRLDANDDAERIFLLPTKLFGEVLSLDSANGQAEIDVFRVERMRSERLTNFASTVVGQFDVPLPTDIAVGAKIVVRGNFGVTADIFTVISYEAEDLNAASFEGSVVSVLTQSPLSFTLDGDGDDAAENVTSVTVELDVDAELYQLTKRPGPRNDSVDEVTEADLATLFSGTDFENVHIHGSYDANTGILAAERLVVVVEDNDPNSQPTIVRGASFEGETFAVTSASPLEFTIDGEGRRIDASITSVIVTLADRVVLGVKPLVGGAIVGLTEAALADGIANGDFDEIDVIGEYDTTTQTLEARIVIAEASGRDEIDHIYGNSVSQVVASPLTFTLGADFGELDEVRFTQDQDVAVELDANVQLLSREGRGFEVVTEAELGAALAADEFDWLAIHGFWDATNSVFTALQIVLHDRRLR